MSIVKSMQNSQKCKQIQVRSCKGLLLFVFSKRLNPQWLIKMSTLSFRGKKYCFASWFFPWYLLCSVSLIHLILLFSLIHTTENLGCTMVQLTYSSTLWQSKSYAHSTDTVFWIFVFSGFSVYFFILMRLCISAQPRLVLNSKSFCLSLLSTVVAGVPYHGLL